MISVWLVNYLMVTLTEHHKLPPFSFRNKEVESRLDNIEVMMEKAATAKKRPWRLFVTA